MAPVNKNYAKVHIDSGFKKSDLRILLTSLTASKSGIRPIIYQTVGTASQEKGKSHQSELIDNF
jgi:hypothetical protein